MPSFGTTRAHTQRVARSVPFFKAGRTGQSDGVWLPRRKWPQGVSAPESKACGMRGAHLEGLEDAGAAEEHDEVPLKSQREATLVHLGLLRRHLLLQQLGLLLHPRGKKG